MSNKDLMVPTEDGKLISCEDLGFSNRRDWYWNYYWKTEYMESLRENYLIQWNEIVGKNRCIVCGGTHKSLHFHHNSYKNLWKEELFKDVIFICGGCHSTFHKSKKNPLQKWAPLRPTKDIHKDEKAVKDYSFLLTCKEEKNEKEIKNQKHESNNFSNLISELLSNR